MLGVCFDPAFAQEREITADEFKNIQQKISEAMKTKSYRIIIKQSHSDLPAGATMLGGELTTEFVPPDKRRVIVRTVFPNRVDTQETVWSGEKRFSRRNGGARRAENEKAVAQKVFANSSKTENRETKSKFKFVETTELNNQKADLYERVDESKFAIVNKTNESEKVERQQVITRRY